MQHPGAADYVMNHGHRRGPIFDNDEDRWYFLITSDETSVKTGGQARALGLMPNSFHLMVQTP